jgi:hypothetical protein
LGGEMTKTVCGSFIICCEFESGVFYNLNKAYPEYKGKSVSVIQCKAERCKGKNTIMIYELIFI